MRNPRSLVWMICLWVSVLGVSTAEAGGGGSIEGGTITFVGAVVEPTCSIAAAPVALSALVGATGSNASLQQSCQGPGGTTVNTSASRIYDADIEHLSGTESDQVLRYFVGYVRAAAQPARADPVLVTQNFE